MICYARRLLRLPRRPLFSRILKPANIFPGLLRTLTIEGATGLITIMLAFWLLAADTFGATPAAGRERLYIGTYTGASSQGIYHASFDLGTGTMGARSLGAQTTSPSFVALHPNRQFLYAVNETSSGTVAAFAINSVTGSLTLLNQQASGGSSPCHLAVDSTGRNVIVANYGSGTVSVRLLPIQLNGRLGAPTASMRHTGSSIDPVRQTGPHAHCITFDPGNRFVLVCDLGLDKIICYRLDPVASTLATNTPPWTAVAPGSGPRHLVFGAGGRFAYVINELNSTITAFAYDPENGALAALQTVSTLPPGYSGQNFPAEIAVHPSGKFLYGSNRGYNSIAVYAVDLQQGTLSPVQQQPTGLRPRSFAIEPTGRFCLVANQDSGNVVVYAIHPQTGMLAATGQALAVTTPVCVVPYLIEAPQPVLSARATGGPSVEVGLGNAVALLSYELHHTPALNPDATWTMLAAGAPGQTNFLIPTALGHGFLRASVVTNY